VLHFRGDEVLAKPIPQGCHNSGWATRMEPQKTKCKSMSLTECQALLDKSLPHSENSRRGWTVQAIGGNYIFFALMSDNTVDEDGNHRFHGYPDDKIPPKVRRQLLAQEGVSASLEQNNNRDSR